MDEPCTLTPPTRAHRTPTPAATPGWRARPSPGSRRDGSQRFPSPLFLVSHRAQVLPVRTGARCRARRLLVSGRARESAGIRRATSPGRARLARGSEPGAKPPPRPAPRSRRRDPPGGAAAAAGTHREQPPVRAARGAEPGPAPPGPAHQPSPPAPPLPGRPRAEWGLHRSLWTRSSVYGAAQRALHPAHGTAPAHAYRTPCITDIAHSLHHGHSTPTLHTPCTLTLHTPLHIAHPLHTTRQPLHTAAPAEAQLQPQDNHKAPAPSPGDSAEPRSTQHPRGFYFPLTVLLQLHHGAFPPALAALSWLWVSAAQGHRSSCIWN